MLTISVDKFVENDSIRHLIAEKSRHACICLKNKPKNKFI